MSWSWFFCFFDPWEIMITWTEGRAFKGANIHMLSISLKEGQAMTDG
jgi:hypothetical protein